MLPSRLSAIAASLLLSLPLCATPPASSLVCNPAESRIDVDVKATVGSFTAHLQNFQPEVVFDEPGHVTAARLRFHFADLKTGKDKRDTAMLGWEEAARYPDVDFVLESLVPASGSGWLARGSLTLHGKTRQVEFPVSITEGPSACVIDGEVQLDTRDYGLPIIRMLGVLKVDPLVRVHFHLQGTREKSA